MIIKLTECRHVNGETKDSFPIWVNMNNFITMNKSISGGKDTHIKLTGAFLFVKETPEEIMRIIYSNANAIVNQDMQEVSYIVKGAS